MRQVARILQLAHSDEEALSCSIIATMASSDGGKGGALRQRKGKSHHSQDGPAASSSSDHSGRKKLQRSQSWHQAAADHVLSRKRYTLLAGVLLGVAGMFVARVVYYEQPIEDMLPIPSETVRYCT